jgi:Tfp pilus assembly protein PilO
MIGEIRDVRTQLLILVGVLLLVDFGAAALLLSPAGRSRNARLHEYERLRVERQAKILTDAPAKDIEKKIAEAREQEISFDQDRLAHRYSAMSEEIARIAKDAGVGVTSVKYDEAKGDKNTLPGYTALGITISIRGNYAQDISFINTVERQKMLLLIDGVSFGGMQGDTLTVSVHLSTYMKGQL